MNEYCFRIDNHEIIWVEAWDEDMAIEMLYAAVGYDPEDIELIEVKE